MRIAFLTLDASGFSDPKSPLKDLRVRQALNYAIDRKAIAEKLVGGSSTVINSACTPSQFGCTNDVTQYRYDIAKAKALMGEAGFSNGFDIDIYGYRSQPVAAAIIGYLRKSAFGPICVGCNILRSSKHAATIRLDCHRRFWFIGYEQRRLPVAIFL